MKIKAFPIIKTSITSKYNRWKNLNSLVSTRYSNTFKIVCISIKMIAKSCYISFIQYINSSVTKIGPNSYELSYIINGKLYKMVVKTQRGPIPVIQVSNDKQDDITDKILPYMGPKYNWHGNVFTPEFFGCDLLIFEMSDGTEHAFDKDTYIIL
jgi:hypothetical protein